MANNISLSDSEWELMKALWQQAPASVNDIAARVGPSTGWHPKTVRTMLLRLHKKGIVQQQQLDKVIHYSPVYSREQCESSAAESFLDKVFDGALAPMLARFSSSRTLSEEDRNALLDMLERDEQRKGEG